MSKKGQFFVEIFILAKKFVHCSKSSDMIAAHLKSTFLSDHFT